MRSCGKEKFPFIFSLLRFTCKHPQPRWIYLSVKYTSKLATTKYIAVFAFSDLSRFLVTVEIYYDCLQYAIQPPALNQNNKTEGRLDNVAQQLFTWKYKMLP